QVIGFVTISRDGNPLLLDQINREGLIHNSAFEDLRRLLHFLLLHLENYRQSIRHPAAETTANGQAQKDGGPLAALERLAASLPPEAAARVRKVSGEVAASLGRLEDRQRRELESYAELAASGQALLGVQSELRAALGTIGDTAAAFEEEVRRA